MLIGLSGNVCAGKKEVEKYLNLQGFTSLYIRPSRDPELDQTPKSTSPNSSSITLVDDESEKIGGSYTSPPIIFNSLDELLLHTTSHWRDLFVTFVNDIESLHVLNKRPFFLHVGIDAPILVRYSRFCARSAANMATKEISLQEFVALSDDYLYSKQVKGIKLLNEAQVSVINDTSSIELLYVFLGKVNFLEPTRLRPSWDAYFMKLADLAAMRSNCMKRRVGCVLVRDRVVIATGYNGTPRGITNCNEGGCSRCNDGLGSGNALSTCLCLHAEENALMEAGRDRIQGKGILYCNTCPCLTCSIKILQSGIKEVVYSQSYSMDDASSKVLQSGGIILRQYTSPSSGIII